HGLSHPRLLLRRHVFPLFHRAKRLRLLVGSQVIESLKSLLQFFLALWRQLLEIRIVLQLLLLLFRRKRSIAAQPVARMWSRPVEPWRRHSVVVVVVLLIPIILLLRIVAILLALVRRRRIVAGTLCEHRYA